MKIINLSVVIAAKNEEEKIGNCLKSVSWADEIVLIDTGSVDTTVKIAEKHGAKVYKYQKGSYSDWKNYGADKTSGDWLLFLDADEEVSNDLKNEILLSMKNEGKVYAIPRKNYILGKEFKHGGQWPDYVVRLFRKIDFVGWKGVLHEQPKYKGELEYLTNPLIHHKHADLESMVTKTNKWSDVEARLLLRSGHPKMAGWRFIRIMLSEFWLRLIIQRGFMDGPQGVIYSFYQVWSRFMTYAKLWEMQILDKKDNSNNK